MLVKRIFIFLLLVLLLRPGVSAAPVQEFVVVVHKDRKVASITTRELKRIFLGKLKKWPDSQAIIPVFNMNSDVHNTFSRNVLNKSQAQLKTYWRKQLFSGRSIMPYTANSSEDVVAYLSKFTNAVSYMSKDAVREPLRPVRIVR